MAGVRQAQPLECITLYPHRDPNLPAQPGSHQWQPIVYYPGVPARDQAEIIELGEGQWRTDISLKLLPSSTAP